MKSPNAKAQRSDSDYLFVIENLARMGWPQSALQKGIGLLCIVLSLSGLAMLLTPFGPTGAWVGVLYALVAGGIIVGIAWMVGPWPNHAGAVAFVAYSDLSVSIGAMLLQPHRVQLTALVIMSVVGIFIGHVLGWRLLLVHCVFCASLVGALVAHAWLQDGVSAAVLFPAWSAALISTTLVPLVVQPGIEGARVAALRSAHDSVQDPLTGLLNRRGLTSNIDAMVRQNGARVLAAVVVIDLDGFKTLNDQSGHEAGDRLLSNFARTLRGVAGEHDRVGRVGGDEFVIFSPIRAYADAVELAKTCVDAAEGLDRRITASVGVSYGWLGPKTLAELQRCADAAMYRVKLGGGGGYEIRNIAN